MRESTKARLTALIDTKYIEERNGLNNSNISAAVKFANKQFGPIDKGPEYKARWTRCFLGKMDRLYWGRI